MSIKLRDLIKAIRACKTAAEERALIQKEKAAIRNAFKQNEDESRMRNVAKLLFINMLGHDTDFGQLECLKLITANTYSEKRIGYLGLTQLFNEKSEILMMATNRMRIDLSSNNNYVVSLALSALSEICTADMCRELASEVAKQFTTATNYIKKKSALAATRIIRKVPETIDLFEDKIESLLEERHHGVLLSSLYLIQEMLTIKPELKSRYVKCVPVITKFLKMFMSGYSAEYDVSGVSDPFLQIEILNFFKHIAQGNLALSDDVSDTLAQIATNTPSNKNAGNAVLFECVNTIMTIESSNTLRTLAINILGKFLNNKDANSRYVSLYSLQKLVQHDYDAVAKHKTIILDCLKESDLSIKKLALNLLYMITNSSNVKSIVKEMINHLLSSEPEFLEELTWKICSSVEKHSPSRRWHIDTMIKVLTLAGNYVSDDSSSSLIHLITMTPELQSYALFKLYFSFIENMNQEGLAKVTLWCIGELGLKLTTSSMEGPDNTPIKVTEEEIISTIKSCLNNVNTTEVVKEYTLTCLMKLFAKFNSKKGEIKDLINSLTTSTSVEVQQRAIEFSRLCSSDWDNTRKAILEPMPILESASKAYSRKVIGEAENEEISNQEIENALIKPVSETKDDLLDLDDIMGFGEKKEGGNSLNLLSDLIGSSEVKQKPTINSGKQGNLLNLLDEDNHLPTPIPENNTKVQSGGLDLFDFGGSSGNQEANKGESFIAFEDQNLSMNFFCTRDSADTTNIRNCISSKCGVEISDIVFQAAVLKHLKLQMFSASSNVLKPGAKDGIIQNMKIVNSMEGKKGIAMKLKLSYKIGGMQVNQEATISNFPSV